MNRNIYIDNMPQEKTLQLFMDGLQSCGWFERTIENVAVRESLYRVTAEPVIARRSSPHYVASAMDGVAVKSVMTAGATESNPVNIMAGDYLEVDTGDFVPKQYDAVIMIEEVNFFADHIQIIKAAVPWQHIRSIGEDMVEGDMILPSLRSIGPYELAALITAGVETVPVIKKPIVAIIPTGTELVESAQIQMAPGDIVESNSYMLMGLARQWGAECLRHDIVIDDRDQIRQAVLEIKSQADMIVICSGSSAGREDYTAGIIRELGEILVHGVAVRPGKPAILGIIDHKPVIGVPGYPISAGLIFNLFARPIIYRKTGVSLPNDDTLSGSISKKLPSPMGVDEYIHVNVAAIDDKIIAYPLNRGAGLSSILVKSDGTIQVPRGQEGLEAGALCNVSLNKSRRDIQNSLITLGSHDMSIDFLIDILYRDYGIRLVSTNVGSMGGIMALRRKETHFAGLHLLDEEGGYNISYLDKYLPNENYLLVNLVKRHQGLVVCPGNPLHIRGIEDLVRNEVRYINRQKGAGTRVLLDHWLKKEGISPASINGYQREEYTHLAVAAAVKNDACDTGMAIFASAKAMGLEFIPIDVERYDLCILTDIIAEQHLEYLLQAIRSDEFKARVNGFGGYETDLTGQVMHFQR